LDTGEIELTIHPISSKQRPDLFEPDRGEAEEDTENAAEDTAEDSAEDAEDTAEDAEDTAEDAEDTAEDTKDTVEESTPAGTLTAAKAAGRKAGPAEASDQNMEAAENMEAAAEPEAAKVAAALFRTIGPKAAKAEALETDVETEAGGSGGNVAPESETEQACIASLKAQLEKETQRADRAEAGLKETKI
jgi:hypothetical protein